MRVFIILLVNRMGVISVVKVILLKNESDPRIIVQLLILLVNYTLKTFEALEFDLVVEPIYFNYMQGD